MRSLVIPLPLATASLPQRARLAGKAIDLLAGLSHDLGREVRHLGVVRVLVEIRDVSLDIAGVVQVDIWGARRADLPFVLVFLGDVVFVGDEAAYLLITHLLAI